MNRILLFGVFLLIGGEGFRYWWFHGGGDEKKPWSGVPRLTLELDGIEQNTGLRSFPVRDYVDTGYLRFDRACFFRLRTGGNDENGHAPAGMIPRSLLFMEYEAGNSRIWNDLFTHPPEVCMRSSGCTLEKVLPSREVTVNGQKIPVRRLLYREPVTGKPLHIFKMVWLPPESPILPSTEKPEKRPLWVKMAFTRIQTPPGAVLLARVRNVEDPDRAWEIVEREMLRFLTLKKK